MTRTPRMTILGAFVRLMLIMAGGYITYLAAPDFETRFFPIVDREYLVPFDPVQSPALFQLQLDRVCWRTHLRRMRPFTTMRRAITLILPNGIRYWPGLLDTRSGDFYSNKDARPFRWEGDFAACTYIPNTMDTSQGFKIESSGDYETHGLWLIHHVAPIVDVPPILGDAK